MIGERVELMATRKGRGSMRFLVRHQTRYLYSSPVRLAEHVLRLNPRPDAGRLAARTLTIEPTPSERTETLDPFGNLVTHVAFDGLSDRFLIESRFELDVWGAATSERGAAAAAVAGRGGRAERSLLRRRRHRRDGPRLRRRTRLGVRGRRARLSRPPQRDAVRRIRHDIRDDGEARPAEETLALGHGACRDVTILFLAACRSLGAPARFVSGYQARAETPDGRRHLHAWPEAFVPGLGWRAYDPTHGVRVTDGHVGSRRPRASCDDAGRGRVLGTAPTSSLDYRIEIETDAE